MHFLAGLKAELMKAAVELRSSSSSESGWTRSDNQVALLNKAKWIRMTGPVTTAQSNVLKHESGSARNMAAFLWRFLANFRQTFVWSIGCPRAAPSSCSDDEEEHRPQGLLG